MQHNFCIVLFGLILFASTLGCSISAAIDQPPPLAVEKAKEGISRQELISIFGAPTHTEIQNGIRSDYFEFVDGYPGAAKSRVLLYGAADVFTLGLAELILWPMEKAGLKGREGKAFATYDKNNICQSLKITDDEGNPWKFESNPSQDDNESEP